MAVNLNLYHKSSYFVAAMSSDDLTMLTSYLPFNLNVDEAAFRRQLVINVHTILTRLRDSSLLQLRRNADAERSTADVSEAFGQRIIVVISYMKLSH